MNMYNLENYNNFFIKLQQALKGKIRKFCVLDNKKRAKPFFNCQIHGSWNKQYVF